MALPLAFVLALVLARTFAGRALATMMQRLQGRPTPVELERAASESLGDPALRFAMRRGEPESWADVEGVPIAPAVAVPGRRWRELGSAAQPVAALGYDAALDDDPELVDAVSTAVLLSFDRSRTDSELQASRRRIATASATERRRIERDLHDSAQQQLVALQDPPRSCQRAPRPGRGARTGRGGNRTGAGRDPGDRARCLPRGPARLRRRCSADGGGPIRDPRRE